MAVFLATSVLGTLACIPVDKKLGRKKTMILGAIIYMVGKVPFLINPYSYVTIYINGITVAVAMAFAFVLFNTNRNNLSDLIEFRSGRRIDSLVSTCDNLAAKLSKAGVNLAMTAALGAAGFNAELAQQPQSALDTICALLGWVPLVFAAIMLIIAIFHPIEKEMAQMRNAQNAQ